MHSTASPVTKVYLVQNVNSAKVEQPCCKWRKEDLGSVKGNQKTGKKKDFCVFCLFGLLVLFGQDQPITEQVFTSDLLGST